ncbi:MAG: PAS domain-containing protein [Planctomycetota bacterium]|nr:MAG: PAS domain-containing protein [Planctomycetota bacterium]REK37470.1 MAG: PAS domain-containing protein [Planctomycetota bacterium]
MPRRDEDHTNVNQTMKPSTANTCFFAATLAGVLAAACAFVAGIWSSNLVWSSSLAGVSVVLMAAGIGAAWRLTRSTRTQRAALRYLESLARMDDAELRQTSEARSVAGVDQGSPWYAVFARVRERLLEQGRRAEALEMNRAALEVRARRKTCEQERIAAILGGLGEPVMAVDRYDELVLANPSAEQLFDFDLEHSDARLVRDLVRCEELLDLLSDTRRHSSREKTRELQLAAAGEEPRWYNVTARALEEPHEEDELSDESDASGAVLVFRDISSHKELQKRNAEFVAAVSHEMKTPLSGIKAYVELLADGDAEDEQAREEFLEVINSQADRLQRLIQNLLNIARIEAGVVEVSKKPQSLNDLLEEAFNVVQPAAEAKNIRLTNELSSMYLGVLVDRDMMSQAAINLLSNAIKYTPEGREVVLRSRLVEDEVEFEVEDQGVGLSEEDQQRVFEKFYRVKKDKSMAAGTGLGLPLAKHIVEDVHGGQLSVRSELGVGSTFAIRLPNAGQMS